jgi:hypothetical protein
MKNTLWQSLFSAFVAGIFLWVAVGSIVYENVIEIEDLGDGRIRKTIEYEGYLEEGKTETIECGQNEHGSYAEEFNTNYTLLYTETGIYIDGLRHGKIKYTYPDGKIEYKCYDMGKRVDCEKSALIQSANESAYNILENEYPWYLFFLNAFDFDEEHVQSFVDRIETILAGYDFDFEEFDDYYDSALEEIEESGEEFSEIMEVNSIKVMVEGYECLKRVELRKAVIDRHRSEGKTTFDIVKSDYPGYLSSVLTNQEATATENDFELFCNELDSRMNAYGPLDTEDPFFTDSIDSRMYTAFYSILMENESLNALVLETKSASNIKDAFIINQLQRYAGFLLKQLIDEGNPENAAIIVGELLEQEYYKGDIIRQCVKQAYSGPASGGSDFAGQWEYWFNTGYDGRVKSSFGQSGSNNIPTDGLAAGMHTLHFRFRDDKGLWSVPQSFIFFKGGQHLSSCEYWFNDDYQNKITVAAGAGQFNASFQAGSLANGMHWLHFRFRDASGVYSPLQSHLFWKTGQKLIAYEFWYDDNFDSRTAGQISGVKEESWIKIIELEAVNFEKISVRYKDSGGLWSSVVSLDVPDPVSASTVNSYMNVSVYPIPVGEYLNISYQCEAVERVMFTIYDLQGKKIMIQNFGTGTGAVQNRSVDVTHLRNGVYLLVIETDNEKSVFKAIIAR